jgi:hypothetical protein
LIRANPQTLVWLLQDFVFSWPHHQIRSDQIRSSQAMPTVLSQQCNNATQKRKHTQSFPIIVYHFQFSSIQYIYKAKQRASRCAEQNLHNSGGIFWSCVSIPILYTKRTKKKVVQMHSPQWMVQNVQKRKGILYL